VGTLTSGTRGLSHRRDASGGRSRSVIMTSIVLVMLIIVDISIIHELSKIEDELEYLRRKEEHDDKRTSD
jgi:hypothetical protein